MRGKTDGGFSLCVIDLVTCHGCHSILDLPEHDGVRWLPRRSESDRQRDVVATHVGSCSQKRLRS